MDKLVRTVLSRLQFLSTCFPSDTGKYLEYCSFDLVLLVVREDLG